MTTDETAVNASGKLTIVIGTPAITSASNGMDAMAESLAMLPDDFKPGASVTITAADLRAFAKLWLMRGEIIEHLEWSDLTDELLAKLREIEGKQ